RASSARATARARRAASSPASRARRRRSRRSSGSWGRRTGQIPLSAPGEDTKRLSRSFIHSPLTDLPRTVDESATWCDQQTINRDAGRGRRNLASRDIGGAIRPPNQPRRPPPLRHNTTASPPRSLHHSPPPRAVFFSPRGGKGGPRLGPPPASTMTATTSLLDELECALAAGTNAQRIEMLSRITDLFVAEAHRYTHRQIDLF